MSRFEQDPISDARRDHGSAAAVAFAPLGVPRRRGAARPGRAAPRSSRPRPAVSASAEVAARRSFRPTPRGCCSRRALGLQHRVARATALSPRQARLLFCANDELTRDQTSISAATSATRPRRTSTRVADQRAGPRRLRELGPWATLLRGLSCCRAGARAAGSTSITFHSDQAFPAVWRRLAAERRRACSTWAATPAGSRGLARALARLRRSASPTCRSSSTAHARTLDKAGLHGRAHALAPRSTARPGRLAIAEGTSCLDEPAPGCFSEAQIVAVLRKVREPAGGRAALDPRAVLGSAAVRGGTRSACSRPRLSSLRRQRQTARCTTRPCSSTCCRRAGLAVTRLLTDGVGRLPHARSKCAAAGAEEV
jgi:hypothetical protein